MTWRTLHTIAHSLMVHVSVLEACIHFLFMYMVDRFFPVLAIKDLTNKFGKPVTPFKLAIGTKPSISHLRVLFLHVLYGKILPMLGQTC